jgi:hypothetical protein
MNLKNKIEAQMLLENSRPMDDFLGLSSNELQHSIDDTFGEKSPVRIKDEIDNKIP